MTKFYIMMIVWLVATRPYKHLGSHFILHHNEKFMVFTTKPVIGLKNHLISEINIEGNPKSQYLVENIHNFEPNFMKIALYEKATAYLLLHQTTLQPFIEKLSN